MKITFLGATHEVTGSRTYIEMQGAKLLVDCGMEQGKNIFENEKMPVTAGEIDCVFVTHSHIDHSGLLPLLYKQGFRGTVYATSATCNLCDIMLRDSASIQMSDAEYATRKSRRAGGEAVEPLYDIEDVEKLMRLFRPCEYGEKLQIRENIAVRFTDIGHLLGSSCVELWLSENGTEKKVVFSGDVGNTDQPIICNPKTVDSADCVVIESTYGDRLHEKRIDCMPALADYIQKTLDRGGNVIIPSFAVGRTQEILYFIREIKEKGLVQGHDGFPVYVDSPLANEATAVFLQCDTEYLDEQTQAIMNTGKNPLVFDGLKLCVTNEQSKALNFDKEPKVIISAGGMCDGGRVRHHLKYNLWRSECLILFVGYQASGTLGRLIHDGARKVKLFGDEIAVNAEIGVLMGISGHADKNGLIKWLGDFSEKPKRVFVNHGDDEACTAFTECLNTEYGYNAFAPYSGTVYDIANDVIIRQTTGVPVSQKKPIAPKKTAFMRFLSAARRLLDIVGESDGLSNKDMAKFASQIESLCDKIRR